MEAFLSSLVLVAVAELGDKTQLLSLMLATRLRAPWAIISGIFVATLISNLMAGTIGVWLAQFVNPQWLVWITGGLFIAFGLWGLKPEAQDDDPETFANSNSRSAFLITVSAFLLAELGDKSQLTTVALAAHFPQALMAVVCGTVVAEMLVNFPAVLLGHRLAERLPTQKIRWLAAALFIITGVITLLNSTTNTG